MNTLQNNSEEAAPRTLTPRERFWAAMPARIAADNARLEQHNAQVAARQEELRPLREERGRVIRESQGQGRLILIRVAVTPKEGEG